MGENAWPAAETPADRCRAEYERVRAKRQRALDEAAIVLEKPGREAYAAANVPDEAMLHAKTESIACFVTFQIPQDALQIRDEVAGFCRGIRRAAAADGFDVLSMRVAKGGRLDVQFAWDKPLEPGDG